MTNGELIELHQALQELARQPLPWAQGKRVRKVRDEVQEEVERIEEARREAMKPYAVVNEDGEIETDDQGNVKFEDGAGWIRESQEFMEQEAEFEVDPEFAIDEQYLVNARLSPNAAGILVREGVVRE